MIALPFDVNLTVHVYNCTSSNGIQKDINLINVSQI